ncbi:MAG: carboxypeptidase M32 [Treponema sp.]|nr:carboxypeptidase M32 [Treponema sp.]
MDKKALLEKLHAIDRECRLLERTASLLHWDLETYLPSLGVEERSEQLALLESLHHERFTSLETERLLEELGSTTDNPRGDEKLPELERDYLRRMRMDYDREEKLPLDFVTAAAKAEGVSQAAWVQARRDNNFAAFLPHLENMIDFARKRSLYWGFKNKVYDGLLDIYEPNMGVFEIASVFTPLRERLSSLLKDIAMKPEPDCSFLNDEFSAEVQSKFNMELMKYLGFNTKRGRLDISAHPFTTTLGSNDVRITTRYFPDNFLSSIFSTIHECGHAFYELNIPEEIRLSCLADGASMGVHESQSRLWENVIGRSLPFWEGLFPLLKECIPKRFDNVKAYDFYKAVNLAKPSLIRVEADEVSYCLHIILRFELEQGLFSGAIKTSELPSIWRAKMKEYLGIIPDTDSEGVLQDVHWSHGSFGYFPSYALGNLYGLQFFGKLKADISSFEDLVTKGDFLPIHDWLRDNIHKWGRRLAPGELLKKVTGEELSIDPFLNYIKEKYSKIYGI